MTSTYKRKTLTDTVSNMKAKVASCMFSWLILAALSSHLARLAAGSPLKTQQKLDAHACVRLSRALLSTVSEALKSQTLFTGFNCTELDMKLDRMLSACEPDAGQNTGCSSGQHINFNQEACLGSIQQDLEQYRDRLRSYRRGELEHTLTTTQDLLGKCHFPLPARDAATPPTPGCGGAPKGSCAVLMRKTLCQELKGFQARTITINRIMGYMAV